MIRANSQIRGANYARKNTNEYNESDSYLNKSDNTINPLQSNQTLQNGKSYMIRIRQSPIKGREFSNRDNSQEEYKVSKERS